MEVLQPEEKGFSFLPHKLKSYSRIDLILDTEKLYKNVSAVEIGLRIYSMWTIFQSFLNGFGRRIFLTFGDGGCIISF